MTGALKEHYCAVSNGGVAVGKEEELVRFLNNPDEKFFRYGMEINAEK